MSSGSSLPGFPDNGNGANVSKAGNGNVIGFMYQNGDGSISFVKVGLLAAVVAYTWFYNPMFLMAMFEIFIILYLFVCMWKIATGLLSPKPVVA